MSNRIAVVLLSQSFGFDGFSFGCNADHVSGQIADFCLPAFPYQFQDIPNILSVDILPFCRQCKQAVDRLLCVHHSLRFAADMNAVVPVDDFHFQFFLNKTKVLVKGTEHADHMFHPFHFNYFLDHL